MIVNTNDDLTIKPKCKKSVCSSMPPFKSRLAVLSLLATIGTATQASSLLEEVIVTAQKREQSIQDVGIAINAFSGDQMKELGFKTSTDVVRMMPGVSMSGAIAGQSSQFSIRGVTQNDFNDVVEAPIAVYIDEGYVAAQQGQTFSLFDIERVEVAKGPQGTLFGRNATGGMAHFISRKPTEELEGYVDLTYGRFDNVSLEAAISGPLADSISGRLAVYSNQHDEIVDNKIDPLAIASPNGGGEDLWNDDTWGIRGQLQFSLSEESDLLVSVSSAETDTSTAQYTSFVPSIALIDSQGRIIDSFAASPAETREAISAETGATVDLFADGDHPFFGNSDGGTRPAGADFFGNPKDTDPDTVNRDFAFNDLNHFATDIVNVKYSQNFDNFTFTSVSDYKAFEKFVGLDADGSPVPFVMFMADLDSSSFSQEFRLNGETARTKWVTGVYYLNIDADTENGLFFPAAFGTFSFTDGSGAVLSPSGLDYANQVSMETDSWSVFGQVDYDISKTWTLIAGLRLIREDKDYRLITDGFVNVDDRTIETGTSVFAEPEQDFNDSVSDDLWTGKVQLDWKPNEDWLVYFSINRGVKSGSFNAKSPGDFLPPLPEDQIPYDEEVLLAYEVGFKSTWNDGALRLNGSAYYYDYSDYQAFVFSNASGVVTNNDAETRGAELELVWSAVEGLDVMLAASYFDAEVFDLEIRSSTPGTESLFRDVKPAFAPQLQVAGLVRYQWEMFGGVMSSQVDASYSDDFYQNIRNFDIHKTDSYTVINARISYTTSDEKWQFTGFVNNFEDKTYGTISFDVSPVCGCSYDGTGKPRWWGMTASYKL